MPHDYIVRQYGNQHVCLLLHSVPIPGCYFCQILSNCKTSIEVFINPGSLAMKSCNAKGEQHEGMLMFMGLNP